MASNFRRQRPTSLTVIAVFHFIFGGLGLLCGLIGLAGQAAGGAGGGNPFGSPPGAGTPQQKELEDFSKQVQERAANEAPLSKPVNIVLQAVGLLLALLMVVAGFGLLQVKPYGWWGSVVYGVVALITDIFNLLFSLLYALPIARRIIDQELKSHPAAAPLAGFLQMTGPLTISVVILAMIYPAIVLLVMSRPTVRAAIRGEGAPSERDEYGAPYGPAGRAPNGASTPGATARNRLPATARIPTTASAPGRGSPAESGNLSPCLSRRIGIVRTPPAPVLVALHCILVEETLS